MTENAVGLHEIRKYKIIRYSQQYSNGLSSFQFWKTFSREMPQLSELAIMTLSIPESSAEVEHSFSLLCGILAAQRTRFTEENVGVHLRMCFNNSSSHTQTDDLHACNVEESRESLSFQLDGGSDNEADIETEDEIQQDYGQRTPSIGKFNVCNQFIILNLTHLCSTICVLVYQSSSSGVIRESSSPSLFSGQPPTPPAISYTSQRGYSTPLNNENLRIQEDFRKFTSSPSPKQYGSGMDITNTGTAKTATLRIG
ncbi:unnamed protein product [Orchesella dallaii]|uniref:HAT C-terminal dimerisation domain-containing protein n=1 Tax=Orchesella dallaii TaxID=48710 RepID=A0ABP1R500_9HEXA